MSETYKQKYDKMRKAVQRSIEVLSRETRRAEELGTLNPQQIRYVYLDLKDILMCCEKVAVSEKSIHEYMWEQDKPSEGNVLRSPQNQYLDDLKANRDELMAHLDAQGGRGVELADEIDRLQAEIDRVENS